jgi:hypothetical protein
LVSEFKAFGLFPLALLAIAKADSSSAFMLVPLHWVRAARFGGSRRVRHYSYWLLEQCWMRVLLCFFCVDESTVFVLDAHIAHSGSNAWRACIALICLFLLIRQIKSICLTGKKFQMVWHHIFICEFLLLP